VVLSCRGLLRNTNRVSSYPLSCDKIWMEWKKKIIEPKVQWTTENEPFQEWGEMSARSFLLCAWVLALSATSTLWGLERTTATCPPNTERLTLQDASPPPRPPATLLEIQSIAHQCEAGLQARLSFAGNGVCFGKSISRNMNQAQFLFLVIHLVIIQQVIICFLCISHQFFVRQT
jgi:hypothetical protein